MSYATLDDMYTDLGLMQRVRIVYSLPGEPGDHEVVATGVKPGSSYAEQMEDDAVNAHEMLFDRSVFHGHGTVLIHSVDAA